MEGLLRREIVYGRDVVRDGKYVAEGSGLASADFYFPLVIQMIRQAGYRKILDIGCGDGTFLRYICEQMPELEGVGIDLSPEAVASGNEQLKRDGLDGRIHLYVGDALEIDRLQPQLRGVDCAATFFVLHELCDQKDNPLTQKFLLSFRDVLPGVPLHIVETIRPPASELRERPGPAIEYFLLHDLSSQKPISREAWKELFRRCGFESVQERYLGFSRSSIFKVR
jgi:SAM-dependent methyltransferase